MALFLREQYVNPFTGFGFGRVFCSEQNKQLLVDFLNTLLPSHHQIQTLSYTCPEDLDNMPVAYKTVLDVYCQGANGERFVVELQQAKHNFFRDLSGFYASFPIQEKALRGEWDFARSPVYSIGVLDFVFKEHRDEHSVIHTVKAQRQNCELCGDSLKFIYIELPKFKKTIDELTTDRDKWLYLLKHLPDIEGRPKQFQDPTFLQLFEVTEIASFSREEEDGYQSSLKYYRDMNNVIETARQEGRKAGLKEAAEKATGKLTKP